MRSLLLPFLALSVGCAQENGIRRILAPPEVAILTPEPEQVFRKGSGELEFLGSALDSYDPPEILLAFWSVDGGEEIAATPQPGGAVQLMLDPEPLELGEHLLELRVVDTDDQEASASVPWILDGAIEAPAVTIIAPGDGSSFVAGTEIPFRGEAVDNNSPPEELEFVWTSSADGVLDGAISADGASVVFATLSKGPHLVTLSVTDRDGEVGTDTIAVDITGDEPTEPTDPGTTPTETEPTTEAQVGDLVFSELYVNPTVIADEVGEWVELYNTSSTPIEIRNYAFRDLDTDSYTIASSAVVPAFGYVVLCASTDPLINGGISCDIPFERETGGPGAMALGNDGDEVVLSRPDGVVIDQVVYDGEWFTIGAATGLDPDQLDASNNDDESMWCDQVSPMGTGSEKGTPGTRNDDCP